MPLKTKSTPTSEKKMRRSKTTSKQKLATTGDQNQIFSQASYKTLEELEFKNPGAKVAGTNIRLVEGSGGRQYIQLWSPLSKQWNMMYRYNVKDEWLKWKEMHANIHLRRSKNKTKARRSVQLERPADDAGRTTKPKARTVSAKDSKQRSGKPRSKSTRRVQGSAKK